MKNFDEKIYSSNGAELKVLLYNLRNRLATDSFDNVQFYIEHCEFEIACESLILSILDENVYLSQEERDKVLRIAIELHIDEDAVLAQNLLWKLKKYNKNLR